MTAQAVLGAFCAALSLLAGTGAAAQTAPLPVAEVAHVRFISDELMNLHHFLYAWVWRTRSEGRPLSQRLAALPAVPFTPEERDAWDQAVRYDDRELASKDLLSEGMVSIKYALVHTVLDDAAIAPALRDVLRAALPIYRRHFWAEHDRVNRAWIAVVADRLATLAPEAIPRLETLYATPWFTEPARADIVWVGSWAGGYTTDGPAHATMSSTHPGMQDQWLAAETVFHEYSHILVLDLEKRLAAALGDDLTRHPVLWHAIQFYLTGEVMRAALARRSIAFTTTSAGLFDRAWPQYRQPIADAWGPYVRGRGTMDDAIAKTAAALRTK